MSENKSYISRIPSPSEIIKTQETPTDTAAPGTTLPTQEQAPGATPAPGTTPAPTSIDAQYAGSLKISVVSSIDQTPVANATVVISYTGDPESPLMTMMTDSSGQTETVELPAPPLDYSLDPEQLNQPYSEYNIQVTAEGYEPVLVSGPFLYPRFQIAILPSCPQS